MMADEFNFLRPEIKNYKAEADADLIPIPGQLELHGRYRCIVLLCACVCALFVADLTVGMEELELHCRSRGRYNFQKIKIETISVRMVTSQKNVRNPNHHYLSKKYCSIPPMCIAIRVQSVLQCFRCPYALRKGKYSLSVLLPFVSQYASQ